MPLFSRGCCRQSRAIIKKELQCRIACSLLHRDIEPSAAANHLTWQEGLETLLAEEDQHLAWLEQIQTYQTLSITSAPDMDAVFGATTPV